MVVSASFPPYDVPQGPTEYTLNWLTDTAACSGQISGGRENIALSKVPA